MYCEHFGLQRQPFNNTPDPTFYYSTPEHEEALATLQYATQQRKGFVLVTGEVGAGKTLIGRMFLRTMEGEASSAVITHTYLSGNQLLASICREFEIEVPEGANNLQLAEKLQEYLLAQYARNRFVVVLLDEAQNLPDDSFEALRMLGNLEADDAKLLQVCILGQPELRERFGQPGMKQINQRLFRRFHLPALSQEQTTEYIQHRLAIAGAAETCIFQPDAVEAVYQASGGTPRLINQICDNALLTGYGQNRDVIDLAIIEQVIDADSVQTAEVSEIMMEETLPDSRDGAPTDEERETETFQELPDPEHVSELATDQVERLRDQIHELAAQPGAGKQEMQNVLQRQGELQRIVSGATTRWMAVRDRIESYRREIQQLVDGLSARYTAQQAQLAELRESSAPVEEIDEIRQMHMREIDRVLRQIENQRAEFTESLGRLESHWTELQKEVATLKTTTVQQEMFEPLCDRLDTWQSEVEAFSDTLVGQVSGLKKQIRHANEQLAVLPELRQSTRAHEESLQRMTDRLAELNRDVTARVSAAEQTIEHVRSGAALKSELDQTSQSHQEALTGLRTHIDTLTAEIHAQIASAREMIGRLSQSATTGEAVAELQARYDHISESLTRRLEALQADTHAMNDHLSDEIDAVKNHAAPQSELSRQRDVTEKALTQIGHQIQALKDEITSSRTMIGQLAQRATTKEALAELQTRYDHISASLTERLESLQVDTHALTEALSGRIHAVEGGMTSRSEFEQQREACEETFAQISRQVRTLKEETASAAELQQAQRAHEETFAEVNERFQGLQREIDSGLQKSHEAIVELESRCASVEDIERYRTEQKTQVAEIHQRLGQEAQALEALRSQVLEAQAGAQEQRRRDFEQLGQRLDEQIDLLKTTRQKFLEQHANVHNRLNELTERSATREEVDQLRRDQDDRSVEILTQIETSRRAILGMIDGVAERLQTTRGEMERLADHDDVAALRQDHEREITLLLSRLDEQKLTFEQRFAEAVEFCRKLQSEKAEAEDVSQLSERQQHDTRSVIEGMAVQRTDLETLMRRVNERCDAIVARIQNIPDRFPSYEEVSDLREKTETDIVDLNRRWQEMQDSFQQLAASAAPAQRLEEVEQELSAHLETLDRDLKQRFNELNERVQGDVESLTRRVDQNVEGLSRRVDEDVEGLSRHVNENVSELGHRLDSTQSRLTEAHRQQTLHLRTIVNKMQEMGQRLFAMERTQPLQFSLTPKEVADLKELLVAAKGRNESLSADVTRAESTSTQLREASVQIEEVMRTWSENASAVQTQSNELRASAGTARELLVVMKRFHEALDAKLKSERWQTELQRGEELASRLEQAVNEARTLAQQLKVTRSDTQEERERCGQEYEAAKSTADRLAKLVAQADDATHKFKGLLTGIMRSTSNISAAIESARVDDEQTRPTRPADDREVTSVRTVQWPTMRTTA